MQYILLLVLKQISIHVIRLKILCGNCGIPKLMFTHLLQMATDFVE